MRLSRKLGLVGSKPTLREFFASIDPEEIWRLSKDSSTAATLSTDQGSSSLPTTPDYRIIFFASGSNFTIGKYNSTSGTFQKYIELGSVTVSLSGTTLTTSSTIYAGVFFTTYSSWPEAKADAFLSRLSATALNAHLGSSASATRLTTINHVADPKKFYLTIFTRNGTNYSNFNASPCDDLFNPVVIAPPNNSGVTSYIYDPSTSGYVAAATVDGTSNASGRSGAFYLLSVS